MGSPLYCCHLFLARGLLVQCCCRGVGKAQPCIHWGEAAHETLPSLTQMGGSLGLKHGKRLLSPLSQDDLDLLTSPGSKELQPLKPQKRGRLDSCHQEETQQRTEAALRELFRHVHNMPDSAKKKKLIRQVAWGGQISLGCACQHNSACRACLRAAPSPGQAGEMGSGLCKGQYDLCEGRGGVRLSWMWLTVELAAPGCAVSCFLSQGCASQQLPSPDHGLVELPALGREKSLPPLPAESGTNWFQVSIPSQPAAPQRLGDMASTCPGC